MAEVFRAHGLRLGSAIWLLVAIWAIGLVGAPLAVLVGRSLTADETAPPEVRREVALIRHDVALARGDWERTVDPERRAEIDRRIRLLIDRARRLESRDGAARIAVGLDAYTGRAGPPLAALLGALARAALITASTLALGWPLAHLLARAVGHGRAPWLLAALAAPYGLDPLLRFDAWRTILDPAGLLGPLAALLGSEGIVVVALVHAHLPVMLVPILIALVGLDPRLVEAARDLGASTWRVHARILIPHAAPGLALGTAATFALATGAFAIPWTVDPGGSGWFAPLVWRQVAETGPGPVAAAGATTLLATCLLVAGASLRLFGVRLRDRLGRRPRHG